MVERRPRSRLRRYQLFTVDLIKRIWSDDPATRIPGVLLAYDMGSGKTGATLTALLDLFHERRIRKALVVAPLLVAQTTWPDEIEEWEHTSELSWTLLRAEDDDPDILEVGDAAYAMALERCTTEFEAIRQENLDLGLNKGVARRQAQKVYGAPSVKADEVRKEAVAAAKLAKKHRLAGEPTQLHVINKEGLPWLFEHFGEANWPYDVIVVDEASMLKSGRKRIKNARREKGQPEPLSRFGILSRVRKHVAGVIELTGTPAPKGLHNLWGLIYLIDLGERLGRKITHFEKRWFSKDAYSFKITPFPHAHDEIMRLVKDVMFSLDPKDLDELPQFVINPIRVRLPPEVLAEYRAFKKTMVSEALDVEAVNRGVLHNKLLQFANGSMYQEDGNDIPIHDIKLEALQQVVDETDGAPLLVAYTYQFDLDRILKRFPKAVVLNETNPRETVRKWNAGQIQMLLAHRASAGHGLNLQYGSNHMVEYGLTSDLELYLQFLKRLLRPGQQFTVFNHVIMAEGTIDEDVFPIYLDPKDATQRRIMEAVRVDLLAYDAPVAHRDYEGVMGQLLVAALAA